MRLILGGISVLSAFVLLASVAVADPQQGLDCKEESGLCTVGKKVLDKMFTKAYQIGYEKGREEGIQAGRSLASPPRMRWVVPDSDAPGGARIIETEPGEIPSIENAYPLLTPEVWE